MYPVSANYKNALLKNVICDAVEGTVTLTDGTEIPLSDSNLVSGSLKITHELCSEYRIGSFNLGYMKIAFFDDDALLRDYSGAKIRITYKIETEGGWEAVPMGIYIVDGQTVKRRRNTISLTAYDYGILFDCAVNDSLRETSGTAEELIAIACQKCGVSLGGIDEVLPNRAVKVRPVSAQIQSYRDLVEWCAVMLCGYAVIDREGKLKIISAKYKAVESDPTEAIIDKYITAFERDSIYVTDTRAWISYLNAYSGDTRKIYKASFIPKDVQAAKAVYTLEKNPLLTEKSASECDEVNEAWLNFIDSFMQRGVNAEIFGDPAIDVGDVLRCSEGDIDQRKSIIGLVTRQEWRYRNNHTIICASAQLSDGFSEAEQTTEDESTDGAETTEMAVPVKVTSQLEKMLEGIPPEKEYTAGEGIFIESDRRIKLREASAGILGGVTIAEYEDLGVKKNSTRVALKNPTSMQTGGIKLGDGLVPYLGFNPNTGFYAPGENCIVHLRLSDGLKFIENNEEAEKGTLEYGENTYGGRAVSLNIGDGLEFDEETGAVKATGYGASFGITILNGFISVKIGEDFEFAEDGSLILKAGKGGDYTAGGGILISSDNEISVNVGKGLEIDGNGAVALKNDSGGSYSAGNGIEISDENEISTKIGEGLEFGSDGAINALPNIESAVIISQADARYLLHNYTEIKYTAGNRIGYAGGQNQIIAQGYIFYKNGGTAPNGTTIAIVNEEDLSLIPDIQMYTDMQFPELAFFNNNAISRIYMKLKTVFSTNDSYNIVYVKEDGSESNILESINNYDNYSYGFALLWNQIQPPGYTSNGVTYPYGCAICTHAYRVKSSKTKYYFFVQSGSYYNIGFANEAEYNAAVGLTYEPIELTQVQETVTEV